MKPTIEQARRVVERHAREHNLNIIGPNTLAVVREAFLLAFAAHSGQKYTDVRSRVALYIPRIVDSITSLLPEAVREYIGRSAIYLSDVVWVDPVLLLGVVSHEIGHSNRDDVNSDFVASTLWAATYLVHDLAKGYEEASCMINDLVISVVVGGVSPGEARDRIVAGMASYRLNAKTMRAVNRMLTSAAASLAKHQLPGIKTPAQRTLQLLVEEGWDPGPWRAAIAA